MKKKSSKDQFTLYFKNFIFGVEDSLVSTVGLLSGIAIADVSRTTIFLSGMVLIFVEGFSMGVGSFLSEDSGEAVKKKRQVRNASIIFAAIIMFFSYFFAGFIPLAPYLFFEVDKAFYISILLSLFALFVLGLITARLSSGKYLKRGFKMMAIGGVAILLGVLVGSFINNLEINL